MVSFSCEACANILVKKKLDAHNCREGFTCLDCNTTFYGVEYRTHTSCISEDQRYQKSVYQGPTVKAFPKRGLADTASANEKSDLSLNTLPSKSKKSRALVNENGTDLQKDGRVKVEETNTYELLKKSVSKKPRRLGKVIRKLGLSENKAGRLFISQTGGHLYLIPTKDYAEKHS